MLHLILCPRVAHQLQHLEHLLEVQVLLVGHHIQCLVKVVVVLAPQGGGQVPGGIQRGAVGLHDQAGGHPVFLQVHHQGALGLAQEVFLPEFVDHPAHLVVEEGLAVVGIKGDAQDVIHPAGILQGQVLEALESLQCLRISFLDFPEPSAPFVLKGGVLLRLLVKPDIKGRQRVHAARLHHLPASPALEGGDHPAKLGAPVAQVVDSHGFPAQVAVNALQAVADHRG